MSTKINVLILGATGYIGGSVLSLFLQREDFKSFHFTALIRSAEKASKLQALGINAVVGSHTDAQLVEKLATENEVIFSLADSDCLDAIKSLLRGVKKQFALTSKPPILIHASGAGCLASNGKGYYPKGYVIYDDMDLDQMASIAPTQLHRNVDLELMEADAEGYCKTYITLPCVIYGIAKTQLTGIGVQNPISIHIPHMIQASMERGQPEFALNSVSDSTLVVQLYDAIVKNPETAHGVEGCYFGENGELTLYAVVCKIGEALYELGKVSSPEPVPLTQSEIKKYFNGSMYLGATARCRGNRARSMIGWKPTKTAEDCLASIKPEVEALVASGRKLAPVPWSTSYQ